MQVDPEGGGRGIGAHCLSNSSEGRKGLESQAQSQGEKPALAPSLCSHTRHPQCSQDSGWQAANGALLQSP